MPSWKTLPREQISSDVLWETTKEYNCYLIKSQGVTLSRDPLNLTGLNTKRDSGIANSQAIGIGLSTVNQLVKEAKQRKRTKAAKVVRVELRVKTRRNLPKRRLVELSKDNKGKTILPTSNNSVYGTQRNITVRAVAKALNRSLGKTYRKDLIPLAFRRLRRIHRFKLNNKKLNKADAKKLVK
jgi:ABC-type transporter Mla subunit MlaD